MSVQKATLKAFQKMPDIFNTSDLISTVRSDLNRPFVYDSTILRKLRILRSENRLNYKCIDNKKSIYKKIEKYKRDIIFAIIFSVCWNIFIFDVPFL